MCRLCNARRRRPGQRLLGIKEIDILRRSALILVPVMATEQALRGLSAGQLHIFSCLEACNCVAEKMPGIANSGQIIHRGFLKTAVYQAMWGTLLLCITAHCQLFFKKEIAASL